VEAATSLQMLLLGTVMDSEGSTGAEGVEGASSASGAEEAVV